MQRIKKERRITQRTVGLGILKGTVWSLAVTAAGAAVMAALILKGVLRETAIGYTAMAVLLLASFIGSALAFRRVGKQLVFTSMLTGAGYFLCLAGLNAVMYKGGFEGVGVTALMILAGSGVTVLMNLKQGGERHRIRV